MNRWNGLLLRLKTNFSYEALLSSDDLNEVHAAEVGRQAHGCVICGDEGGIDSMLAAVFIFLLNIYGEVTGVPEVERMAVDAYAGRADGCTAEMSVGIYLWSDVAQRKIIPY